MSNPNPVVDVSLHETARHRYLNYALSVISSRALPDVRDGLKPVHRRIIYAMYHNLNLRPEGRFRKSAAVVGEVMAKYHPHGDSSIYEALVRMAQPFTMRHPLVDGQGNFGSMDGDGAAAMRYTECKLQPLAVDLVEEIKKSTVDFQPNYDGQHWEPEVLPVQFPQILVNGSEGIAVGMATRIPPHNLREVLEACLLLLDNPDATVEDLCGKLLGPDFPTGGQILTTPEDLLEIYKVGRGTVVTQARWRLEKRGRTSQIIVYEIPYGVNKGTLVEKIGNIVADRKLPMATDVRDESAQDVRVVIEVKSPADVDIVMSYLLKNTPLRSSFPVNLTCLVPGSDPNLPLAPQRCDLRLILESWLKFRNTTVRRRFENDLRKLRNRLHLLEGFETIFASLDAALKIIRGTPGKKACAAALRKKFKLSEAQAGVILETPLYKISSLEETGLMDELEQARTKASGIEAILGDPEKLWGIVREELIEVHTKHGEPRLSEVGAPAPALVAFKAEDLIQDERTVVLVTLGGWVKRMAAYRGEDRVRVPDGDALGWVLHTTTKKPVTFYSNLGRAYTVRAVDIEYTSGNGEPLQKLFALGDGERLAGVTAGSPEEFLVAMTKSGRILRCPSESFEEVSTKRGRRYLRLKGADDEVLAVYPCDATENASVATTDGHVLCFPLSQAQEISPGGRGLLGVKMKPGNEVLAFELCNGTGGVEVSTSGGRKEVVTSRKWPGKRGSRGKQVIKRGSLVEWSRSFPVVVSTQDGK
jgi:DNA gyrase subunit A